MRLHWRKLIIGIVVVAVAFVGAVWAINRIWSGTDARRPALVSVPPLAPVTRNSLIVAPAAIALTAVRDAMEREAPRELSGKPDLRTLPFTSNIDIGWTVARGPFSVSGGRDELVVSAALNGAFKASGELATLGGILNPPGGSLSSPGSSPQLPGGLGGLIGDFLGGSRDAGRGKA